MSFINSLANSLQATLLAGSLALGLSAGCRFDPGGLPALDGSTSGDGGTGGDGGMGGDGGRDAGSLPAGPSLLRPGLGEILPATRAHVLWQAGEIPTGLTVDGYELCSTIGPALTIDEESECPNSVIVTGNHALLDPLTPSSTNRVKLRSRFNNGTVSLFSDLSSFEVNDFLRARYLMNGDANDSAILGIHNGTLLNGASFGMGRVGQGLLLDGANDFVSVPHSVDFNFGVGDFAIAVWLNPSSTGTPQAIVDKRDGASLFEFYRRTDGSLAFTATGCTQVTGGMVPQGSWRHGMVTRIGGMLHLYVDGVEVGTSACAANLNNTGALGIGCLSPDVPCTEPFAGSLDEVLILGGGAAVEVPLNEYCSAQAADGVDPLPPSCQP